MKNLKIRLYERYNIYWAMNHDDESKSHIEENCEIKELFDWDSENMLFVNNSCCFKCELSRNIYENYINKSYSSFNFIKTFVLIEIHQEKLKILDNIKEMIDWEFNMKRRKWSEILKWFEKSYRSLEFNEMNLFEVFYECLRREIWY